MSELGFVYFLSRIAAKNVVKVYYVAQSQPWVARVLVGVLSEELTSSA